jgi:hypothetical protein
LSRVNPVYLAIGTETEDFVGISLNGLSYSITNHKLIAVTQCVSYGIL